MLGFAIGVGPLTWAMNAELFPKEAQGVMASLATAFNWACSFVVTKFSSNLQNQIDYWGLYFLFGSVCALGTIFVVLIVPETKGKTPDDMKAYFMGLNRKQSLPAKD